MNERTVAEAIGGWLSAADLVETAYPYPISSATGALPDAVVLVSEKTVTDEIPPDFPMEGLQQNWARLYAVEVSVMTEVEAQDAAAADAADAQLRAIGASIESLAWEDASLAGHLAGAAISPRMRFDYSTPFAEREDGVRGRFVVIELNVCEPIEAPF